MITATVEFKGVAPLSFGKWYKVPKNKDGKESHADYEERTWRERLHVDKDDNVLIPPMMFKNCLAAVAKYLNIQIPGKGKATYTKHFEAGVMVTEPVVLPVKKADVEGHWVHVPSDGRRGGTTRVPKCFPIIHEWGGKVDFLILDETITEDVFKHFISEAGKFVGLGVFRPRNNGYFGRFEVVNVTWGSKKAMAVS